MVKKVNSTGTRAQVWHGTAKSTTGGLHKGDLMKNKHGRIVSKKKHAAGKKALKYLHNAGYIAKKGSFGTKKSGTTKKKTKTSLTKAMFDKLDSNKDKVIDYSEFIKGLKSQKGGGKPINCGWNQTEDTPFSHTCDRCRGEGIVWVEFDEEGYGVEYIQCTTCTPPGASRGKGMWWCPPPGKKKKKKKKTRGGY